MVLFAMMIAVWGCNSDSNSTTEPTDPSDAVGTVNGNVAGTPGDLYTTYNEETRFGVSLSSGCWLLRYQLEGGTIIYWAAANVGDSVIGLVNVVMSETFGGTGPARNVAVAPNTGTECSEVNTVVFLGDQNNLPPLSAPPAGSAYVLVIDMDGNPLYPEGSQPIAP